MITRNPSVLLSAKGQMSEVSEKEFGRLVVAFWCESDSKLKKAGLDPDVLRQRMSDLISEHHEARSGGDMRMRVLEDEDHSKAFFEYLGSDYTTFLSRSVEKRVRAEMKKAITPSLTVSELEQHISEETDRITQSLGGFTEVSEDPGDGSSWCKTYSIVNPGHVIDVSVGCGGFCLGGWGCACAGGMWEKTDEYYNICVHYSPESDVGYTIIVKESVTHSISDDYDDEIFRRVSPFKGKGSYESQMDQFIANGTAERSGLTQPITLTLMDIVLSPASHLIYFVQDILSTAEAYYA